MDIARVNSPGVVAEGLKADALDAAAEEEAPRPVGIELRTGSPTLPVHNICGGLRVAVFLWVQLITDR